MTCPEFFDKITAQFEAALPFVAYRKPGESAIRAIFQKDDRLHPLKSFEESGFVFAPFDSEAEKILLKPDEFLECPGISNLDFETKNKSGSSGPGEIGEASKIFDSEGSALGGLPRRVPNSKDLASEAVHPAFFESGKSDLGKSSSERDVLEKKASYLGLVDRAIDEINKGTFRKVVLSRCLDASSKTPPVGLFQRLLSQYPKAFCYFWYHPQIGVWMGATPEILLKLRHRQLTTMSLAGTQNYSGTANPKWGHKELEEQELVTDYILDALRDQVSDLRRTPTETVRAGDLVHLRTKISGSLKSKPTNLGSIIDALHPTPAVCGLPKKEALKFIIENEHYDRQFYTGFLGELNLAIEQKRSSNRRNQENQAYRSVARSTTLFVNLRCMKLADGSARIFVGGGITKDSDPEREWEETVAKSKTMLKILD